MDPPMPHKHKPNIKEVQCNQHAGFPKHQLPISQENQTEACRNYKRADIAHEALAPDLEWPDKRNRSRYHCRYEARRTNQLPNSKTPTICAHRSKRREDIRASIAKSEKRHAGEVVAHAKKRSDCAQVDREEVASRDADGAEEQAEPDDDYDKGDGLCVRETAVVEG